jgi:hypothetical protein
MNFCPSCHRVLESSNNTTKISLDACNQPDHTFIYDTQYNFWYLKASVNNIQACVGYDGNYFTMASKGPNQSPMINIIEPFQIKDSPIILKRFIKLMSFL